MLFRFFKETFTLKFVNRNGFENPITSEKRFGKDVRNDSPRVSIITPAYNVAEYIADTLDSALAQTFKNFEMIVVNDGSPDTERLEEVLTAYFDKIIYIKQKNAGAAAARNTGIESARGEFIAFLDGDDLWLPEKLATQIKFLDESEFQMVYCDAEFFGDSLHKRSTFMEQSPSRGEVTTISLINTECNVITSGTILAKSVLDKFGYFDLNTKRSEDFELWFRLAKNGVKIGYQEKVLIKYRVGTSGLSGDNIMRAERNIDSLNVIKDRNVLDEQEEKVWQEYMKLCQAELNLEQAKTHLANENYAEARKNFREANKFYRKSKYSLINFLLRINPKLALLLFKKIRPTEFEFIAPNDQKI
jgi:glycosyltransferase involved in cell wall biosynthesis